MPARRLLVFLATFLALTLGLQTSALAKKFSLTGGGGQTHIGNGLALPIQQAIPPIPSSAAKTAFPPLLIPVAGPAIVNGTVAKALDTAMATVSGPITKQGYQRRLEVPANVLSKPAAQTTVGVKFSNLKAFAVGTNLRFRWPSSDAVFSTGEAVASPVIVAFSGSMTYSNTLGQRFGGAGRFALSPGSEPSGLISPSPVTVYIKINGTTPPCTHNTFGGTDVGCVAGILHALATGNGAIGASENVTIMTPGGALPLNVARVQLGLTPSGTINNALLVAFNPVVPTNMASSQAGPWTTGQIIITNTDAAPDEIFTLEGRDLRTAGGAGTIQMVAGSTSDRTATGGNANRGWVRLVLGSLAPLPSMSRSGMAVTAGMILLLTVGYATRRRLFA